MCTALTYLSGDFYMGRTLDYERGYGEEVVVTPRAYPFAFRHEGLCAQHYAIIGTACVADGYPLYYDAVNEKGLGMAGLNFVGNAAYAAPCAGKRNVAQFEFIPWLLGRCAGLAEARTALAELNLVGTPFSAHFPAAQLHWLVADRTGALVVESMADGLHVYDCPEGVLTNNPPFPIQHFGLNRYMGLSPRQPENRFSDQLELSAFSRGMGALGLPGDLSSGSRFVRAAFVRANSRSVKTKRRASDSFSTSSAQSNSRRAAARCGPASLSTRSTPPAGTHSAASITTRPTAAARFTPWPCTEKISTAHLSRAIPCRRRNRSNFRIDRNKE